MATTIDFSGNLTSYQSSGQISSEKSSEAEEETLTTIAETCVLSPTPSSPRRRSLDYLQNGDSLNNSRRTTTTIKNTKERRLSNGSGNKKKNKKNKISKDVLVKLAIDDIIDNSHRLSQNNGSMKWWMDDNGLIDNDVESNDDDGQHEQSLSSADLFYAQMNAEDLSESTRSGFSESQRSLNQSQRSLNRSFRAPRTPKKRRQSAKLGRRGSSSLVAADISNNDNDDDDKDEKEEGQGYNFDDAAASAVSEMSEFEEFCIPITPLGAEKNSSSWTNRDDDDWTTISTESGVGTIGSIMGMSTGSIMDMSTGNDDQVFATQ